MRSSELYGRIRTAERLHGDVAGLIDTWCERRCLNALRFILAGWPVVQGLTDDWVRALDALKAARTVGNEITQTEAEVIADAIQFIERVLER